MLALIGTVTAIGRAEVTGTTLTATAGPAAGGFRLDFTPESTCWQGMQALVFEAEATSPGRVQADIAHCFGHWTWYFLPKPGLLNRVVVTFADLSVRPPNTCYPGYFTFGGGPQPVAFQEVLSITFRYDQPGPETRLAISNLRLEAEIPSPAVLNPHVCVDQFGQWIGLGGMPRSTEQISANWAVEPKGVTEFPHQTHLGSDPRRQLEATGFFRITKDAGRWTLIDPEGYRFFSVGPTCVNPTMAGPVNGREFLFAALPDLKPMQRGRWSGQFADFYHWNLERRYGSDCFAGWAAQVEARLRQWGYNTIANWSDEQLCARGRIPYTDRLKGLDPMCQHVPDVFAPDFAETVRQAVAAELTSKRQDPMLIGYFVGNEPGWTFPGAIKPFATIFRANNHPYTRADALQWLEERYATIEALNAAWGTTYAVWIDLDTQGVPDPRTGNAAMQADADAYTGRVLERFYSVCCQVIQEIDPNHLLLGARYFTAAMPDSYIEACRCFDVFSFNCYHEEIPADLVERVERLAGIPSMIGEFHMGMVGNGRSGALISVLTQEERGAAYERFVRSAAAHPAIIGVHWFQWVDEPVTGRFDGEDYNCGLVSIQDIPYEEMLASVDKAHAVLYQVRFGND